MTATNAQVELKVAHDPCVSLALYQNYVPMIQRITVDNRSLEPLDGLTLAVWIEPLVAVRKEIRVDRLLPGSSCQLERVEVELAPRVLAAQRERERGRLCLELRDQHGVVASHNSEIGILAYNEWPGTQVLPEILAAFVLPNHPEVARILRLASEALARESGDGALDGYQRKDPARVRVVLAAIWSAVGSLDIGYVAPPASFEQHGQKIRTPDQVVGEHLGTCLDLSVLLAACIEQAGLHALLVLQEGHALVGAWLVDERFSSPVVYEAQLLRKRVELGLIEMFETTLATQQPLPGLAAAADAARAKLAETERFVLAIDVIGARSQHIRPIPVRVAGDQAEMIVHEARPAEGQTEAGSRGARAVPSALSAKGPRTRLDVWKQRLLDLTLRNRLLNFRAAKSSIPLRVADLAALEDALVQDRELELVVDPGALGQIDPRDPELYRQRHGEDPERRRLADWLAAGKLCASIDAAELDRRVVKLYRDARTSLEDGGVSILYLALGFLRWREAPTAPPRLAPILLLPIELVRPSVKAGFRMRLSGDESPRLNITLLKKLEVDFGLPTQGLDAMVEDAAGLDVAAILQSFRTAVLPQAAFEVVEDAALGLFSFTKFLMWRDLEERTDQLLRNDVVRHLVEQPEQAFDAQSAFPAAGELDRTLDLAQNLCPLDADSSQLAAVVAAAQGRSFVLQGPPGTGKSQTIANLIAQCLADGKRVLFVSEKMAALNVVHRRLAAVGLAPFCLELHSNKASKKEMLDQLGAALAVVERREPEQWGRVVRDLEQVRAELNQHCELLHRQRALGVSAFQGMARAVAQREAPRITLPIEPETKLDEARLTAWRRQVEQMAAVASAVAPLAEHPWRAARCSEWDPGLDQNVAAATDAVHAALVELRGPLEALCQALGIAASAQTHAVVQHLATLGEGALPGSALLDSPDWTQVRAKLAALLETGRRRDAVRSTLLARYDVKLIDLDLTELRAQLQRAAESFVLFRRLRRKRVEAALRAVVKGAMPLPPALADDLQRAQAWQTEQRALQAAASDGERCFGSAWRGGEADWQALERVLTRTDAVRAALTVLGGAGASATGLRALAVDGPERVAAGEAVLQAAQALVPAVAEFNRAFDGLQRLVLLDTAALWTASTKAWPDVASTVVEAMRGASGKLRAWTGWARARQEAVSGGLTPLVEGLERGSVAPAQAMAAFERAFFSAWVDAVLQAEPELRRFRRAEHGQRITRFGDLEGQVLQLSRDVLHARLASRLPKAGLPDGESEVGILQRQLKKQRGHWPIRRLFVEIPHLLPRLKPCLLMSPLSVAQYLDPSTPPFDLVVFDEASQIPVQDAIGVIGRGVKVVVVGDSRQLPPTNFFARVSEDEEADEEMVEELESILDECVAARLPSRNLDWHYRSRHENLIAFSNWHYYGGRLLTFPAAHDRDGQLGVVWHHVQGVYDRAKTRQNRAEAEAVVAEIVARVHGGDPRSIGVVTFSQPQQTLVEDLLDQARRTDQALDNALAQRVDEALFVKNLENVQGDERDVILFSVGYGPDAQGRVLMNFGPLNKPGGERRLNVAITRAREQIIVFSTLLPEQIDLGRVSSTALGVRHLRTFLEYAQSGPRVLGAVAAPVAGAKHESPLEADVGQALAALGYLVDAQVGCSGYRIDLGIRDPAAPGRYVLGVECDGASYHSAKTARDRDRLRQAVLESLGWRLHRIWSTDWFYDRSGELQRVQAAIEAAKLAPVTRQPQAPAPEPTRLRAALAEKAPEVNDHAYETTPLDRPIGDPESFFQHPAGAMITARIEQILAVEAPISLDLLLARLAPSFALQRITPRVRERIHELLPGVRAHLERVGERTFLWRADQDPASYFGFRVAAERSSADIAPAEIANAAASALRSGISMTPAALVREAAKLLGFARVGKHVEADMAHGIELLVARGGAKREGEAIVLPR